MKKNVEIEVVLLESNEVIVYTGSYISETHTRGTINFIATYDGRKKTINEYEVLLKAGLIKKVSEKEEMFPRYEATDEFHKIFNPEFMSFSPYTRVKQMEKVKKAIKKAKLDFDTGWNILKKEEINNSKLYNSSVDDLVKFLK